MDQHFNAKVADFGISVDVSQTNGQDNHIRGTPYYMAPEVASWTLTETYDAYKADVYSLGVLLHVMLYGEFPLRGDTETCSNYNSDSIKWGITNKLSKERNINEDLASGDLQNLLARMLSIDPDKRPCISEILEWEWVKTNLNETLIQDVFEEMEQRKNFIYEYHLSPN